MSTTPIKRTDLLRHRETSGKFQADMLVSDALTISQAWVEDRKEMMASNGQKKLHFQFCVGEAGDAWIIFHAHSPKFLRIVRLPCKANNKTVDTTRFFALLNKLDSWVTSRLQDTWKNETYFQMTRELAEMVTKKGMELQAFAQTPYESADTSVYAFVLRQIPPRLTAETASLCMLVKVDDWEVQTNCYKFPIPWVVGVWDAWCERGDITSREDITSLEEYLVSLSDDADDTIPRYFGSAEDEAALATLCKNCVHYLETRTGTSVTRG